MFTNTFTIKTLFTSTLFFFGPGLFQISLAQSSRDLVIFDLANSNGTRVEIVVSEEPSSHHNLLLRVFENGEDLSWEGPLDPNFAINGPGFGVTSKTVLQVDVREAGTQGPQFQVWQQMVVDRGVKEMSHGSDPVIDTSGTTIPPTGPPTDPPNNPPNGGGN